MKNANVPETITRSCGHLVEFTPKGDRYDDARRDKLRKGRCVPCGVAKNQADNLKQQRSGKVKKGTETKQLPVGTLVSLTVKEDGWHGTINADGTTVETSGTGAMGILSKLARKWLAGAGPNSKGR